MVYKLIRKNRIILPLILLATVSQIFIFGFGIRVLINILFQLIVSYILSYVLTTLKHKSFQEDLQLKLWNIIFAFMATMLFIANFVFPKFEGFK
jgi:hypothetical protein